MIDERNYGSHEQIESFTLLKTQRFALESVDVLSFMKKVQEEIPHFFLFTQCIILYYQKPVQQPWQPEHHDQLNFRLHRQNRLLYLAGQAECPRRILQSVHCLLC